MQTPTPTEPMANTAAHWLWAATTSGKYHDTTSHHHSPAIDALQAEFGLSGEPWCAMFVCHAFRVTAKALGVPSKFPWTASSQDLLHKLKALGVNVTTDAEQLHHWRGALAILTDADGVHGHVTTVLGRLLDGSGKIHALVTAEGNTNDTGGSNGVGAFFHQRNVPLGGAWHFCDTTSFPGGSWWGSQTG